MNASAGARLLSTGAAARLLGISRVTVWRLVRTGELRATRLATRGARGHWRVSLVVVERFRVAHGL